MTKRNKIVFGGTVAALLLVLVLVSMLSLHGVADTGDTEEIVSVMYEVNKAKDAERYLGKDAINLYQATEQQKSDLGQRYTTVLNEIYAEESLVESGLEIFQRKLNATTASNLRSIDMVCIDYEVNELEINESAAAVNLTWISCEKVIIKDEEGRYVCAFPLTKKTVAGTLIKTEQWKVQEFQVEDYILGDELEALSQSFDTFEAAYEYSVSVIPKDTGNFSLDA